MSGDRGPSVWFPTIRAGTGADVFTERLVAGLIARGIRAEITWLPLRAEYAPWTVTVPRAPAWANVVHVNTWLHPRFIPQDRPVVAAMLHCVHDPRFRPYQTRAQRLYHRLHIKRIERHVLERADAIVAISRYTAERTRDVFGTHGIRVILPGIDLDGPYRPAPRHAPHTPFRLVFAGTGSRRKGADLLVPIMRRLGGAFHLAVVGTDSIGESALPGNISVLGRLPTAADLAALYQRSDALLFPSRLEGFGQVVVEAMACGLPVIATRGSALTEVVEDGVTGILCRQDDITNFARAAQRLAADEQLFTTMGGAGMDRVRRDFSATRMVDAYIDLYRDCTGRLCRSAPMRSASAERHL